MLMFWFILFWPYLAHLHKSNISTKYRRLYAKGNRLSRDSVGINRIPISPLTKLRDGGLTKNGRVKNKPYFRCLPYRRWRSHRSYRCLHTITAPSLSMHWPLFEAAASGELARVVSVDAEDALETKASMKSFPFPSSSRA